MKFMKPLLAAVAVAGFAASAANASTPAASSWADSITLSADALFGYHNVKQGDVKTASADLINANLNMDAKVNASTSMHVGTHYDGSDLSIDTATITMKNVADTTAFVKLGKDYVPFGNYSDAHAVIKSMTQDQTQANENFVQLGYSDDALSGSFFLYKDAQAGDSSDDINKFGFRFGFAGSDAEYKYNANVSYVNDYRTIVGDAAIKSAAYDVFASVATGPFTVNAEYVTASKEMATDAGKEKVWGVNAAYAMNTAGYASNLHVAYEKADNIAYDKRFGLGYGVELSKHVNAGLEYSKNTAVADGDDVKQFLASVKVSA